MFSSYTFVIINHDDDDEDDERTTVRQEGGHGWGKLKSTLSAMITLWWHQQHVANCLSLLFNGIFVLSCALRSERAFSWNFFASEDDKYEIHWILMLSTWAFEMTWLLVGRWGEWQDEKCCHEKWHKIFFQEILFPRKESTVDHENEKLFSTCRFQQKKMSRRKYFDFFWELVCDTILWKTKKFT